MLLESLDENTYDPISGNLWNRENIEPNIIPGGEIIANFEIQEIDLETTFYTDNSETELEEFLFADKKNIPTESIPTLRSTSQVKKDFLIGVEAGEQLVGKSTDQEPKLLFTEVPQKRAIEKNIPNSPIARQREVKLDFSLLDNTDKSDKTIRLNLFPDVSLDVELEQVKNSPNKQDWVRTGKVLGVEKSQVTIISSKDENEILGEIRLDYADPEKPDGFYEIRSLEQDKFVVNELQVSPFPQCYVCGKNHQTSDHENNESNLEDTLGNGKFDSVFDKILPRKIASLSSNKKINGLLAKTRWDTGEENTITYSFLSNQAVNSYYGSEKPSEVSNAVKNNVRDIFNRLEQYIDVDFQEVADTANNYGEIRIMFSDGPLQNQSRGYTYFPPDVRKNSIAGDIHLSSYYHYEYDDEPGSYGYITLAHEIGHSLGLKHPGNYSDGERSPFLSYAQDNNTNTMMTYVGLGGLNQYSTTPMAYDIQALQYLYGRNNDFNSENTTYSFDSVYGFSDGSQYLGSAETETKLTLWDGGGFDTIDLSKLPSLELADFTYDYRIDLREGGFITTADAFNKHEYIAFNDNSGKKYKTSTFGTTIAYNTTIENLINSPGDDVIFANDAANKFMGYKPGKYTGDDKIIRANRDDILDLSEYRPSQVKRRRQGKDLVLDLGEENGSITISKYYQVKPSKRMKILFNEPTKPQITINDITVNEGNNGRQKAIFTVSLSEASDETVKVKFVTANDSAEKGSDYLGRRRNITFKPGQTTKRIAVPVLGDTADELDETFVAKLRKPKNATIADNEGVATIKNDDVTNISINDATVTEGNRGIKRAKFKVSLDRESAQTIKVDYQTLDSTAISDSDYRAKTGTLTFKPGQISKTIKVPIIGEKQVENVEYFWVQLSNARNAEIDLDNRSGLGTIKDND
ncbi:MAG: Calx-beta domain-containing protein [Microcoleaceae cyanobacterium MO_207.B10]|nr:Calx-beta domain-containing protein [Microcoleaceae cyanobacterium MO_207.B10]